MAYVEVWKGGKLITRRPVSEERAQKGCRIRLGSSGQVRIRTGETKAVGKFEVRMFAGEIPATGQELTLSTSADTGLSKVTGDESYFPEIEGYKVTGRLGEGGMGTVWRAEQLSTHREVALKLLSERRFESKKSRLRFEREVELTARLAHPNIARLYDSGLYRGVYYYAMEMIDGVPLDEYVQKNHLSRMEILGLIYQVSEAVGYAHEQGIIHRDLKPSNILVSEDGQPHVLDFGLAKSTGTETEDVTVSIEGEIAGTPAYMAPEQAAGNIRKIGTRTDVYSLGVLLYYLLTGRLPYDMEGSRYELLNRIIQDEIPNPRRIEPSIDRELEAILMTALAKEPNERYPSAVVFGMDIDNYLEDEPILAKMRGTTYYLVKKIKKHRVPVSVGVVVFLVILSAVLIAYTKIIQSNTRVQTIRGELEIQKQAAEMARSEADSFKDRWDDLEATILSGRKEKDIRAAMLALKEEYLRTQKLLEGTPEEKAVIQAVAENYLNVFGQYKGDSFKALKRVFSDSCISFDSNGRVFKGPEKSVAHLMQEVKSSAEKFDFKKTASETATIQVSGNNAFMIGQLISRGKVRGENELVVAKRWYMLIFQKIRNKWLIASEYCASPEITVTSQGSNMFLNVDCGILYCAQDVNTGILDIFMADPKLHKKINLTRGRLASDWSQPWEPVGSPDGQTVVLRQFKHLGDGKLESKIWLLDIKDLNLQQVPGKFGFVIWFTWSPDSSSFAFSDNDNEIVVDRKTLKVNTVATGGGRPYWSPDGQWLAFTQKNDNIYTLQLVSPQEGEKRPVTTGLDTQNICWSPDSQKLAVVKNSQLSIVLLNGEIQKQYYQASDVSSWSPDGTYIAYETRINTEQRRLWILSLTDEKTTQVDISGDSSNGVWGPESDMLAFWNIGDGQNLMVVGSDGKNPQRVDSMPRPGFMPPSWLPVRHAKQGNRSQEK